VAKAVAIARVVTAVMATVVPVVRMAGPVVAVTIPTAVTVVIATIPVMTVIVMAAVAIPIAALVVISVVVATIVATIVAMITPVATVITTMVPAIVTTIVTAVMPIIPMIATAAIMLHVAAGFFGAGGLVSHLVGKPFLVVLGVRGATGKQGGDEQKGHGAFHLDLLGGSHSIRFGSQYWRGELSGR
jgi:hypothetical protein